MIEEPAGMTEAQASAARMELHMRAALRRRAGMTAKALAADYPGGMSLERAQEHIEDARRALGGEGDQ